MAVPVEKTSTFGPDGFKDSLAPEKKGIGYRKGHDAVIRQTTIPRDDHRQFFSQPLVIPQALNFLAHFHLARPTDASRVGGLLGDFVRGNPEALSRQLPKDLVEGIMLHRFIDQFTDQHPSFLSTKKLLDSSRRRFAGIIIDLFFDHFLSVHWADYSTVPLDAFIAEIHEILERRRNWLPHDVAEMTKRMDRENWLGSYDTIAGIALTLRRVSRRRIFLAPLAGAEKDLAANYQEYERAFQEFYPELLAFVSEKNAGGALNSP